MEVLQVLLGASLLLGAGFLIAFLRAARAGQFDDTQTPAWRILNDDLPPPTPATALLEKEPHEH